MVEDANLNREVSDVAVESKITAVRTEAITDPPPPYTLHKTSQPSKAAPVPPSVLNRPSTVVQEPNPNSLREGPADGCQNPRPQSSDLYDVTVSKAISECFYITLYWTCFPCMWSSSLCCTSCPEPSKSTRNKCHWRSTR